MNLALITGSMPPGKDGVGDYTRLLAEECQRAGHRTVTLAINDRFIAHETAQPAGPVPGLRLDAALPWAQRIAAAQRFLDAAEIDTVGLQYVGYSYHPKGWPLRLAGQLAPLVRGRRLHLMFHELWIGDHPREPLKDRLIGALQKWAALRVIRRLKPVAVATSNPAYAAIFQRLGVDARVLPMFGTLPVAPPPGEDWLFARLQSEIPGLARRDEVWIVAMFGALHPVWPPRPIFAVLAAGAAAAGRRLVVASAGRLGPGENLWSQIQQEFGDRIHFLRLGEQPSQIISEFLHSADFGLSTSSWELVGKSASTACMLDHGLPVIVNRDDAQTSRGEVPSIHPQLIRLDTTLAERLPLLRRQPAFPSVQKVAAQFLAQLR